jgi:hypothetical protein
VSRGSRLFWLVCLAYALTAYGGTRSPDAEVTFRVGEALVDHGRPDVKNLELWPGFGAATGRDGRQYAVFGPLISYGLAPFIAVAGPVADRLPPAVLAQVPISHYDTNGLESLFNGAPLAGARSHAVRWPCSPFNVLVGALAVIGFRRIQRRLCGASFGADAATALFAFGTLLWPYAGTFLSEPLAMACAIFALDLLLPLATMPVRQPRRVALAGALLGLSVAAHVSLVLFVPFFALYLLLDGAGRPRADRLREGAWWLGGLGLVLAALGAYNAARFGSPLETGRGVDLQAAELFQYGVFTGPWPGLYGLLLGSAKGLFIWCPAVIAGLYGWRHLNRKWRALSLSMAAALVFRLLFLACRSDWHGGYAAGPRYLVVAIPFLLLPVGLLADDLVARGRRRLLVALGVFSASCATLTLYISLGDVFRHFQSMKLRHGAEVFLDDRVYLDWALGPLGYLYQWPTASYLPGRTGLGVPILMTALGVLVVAGFALLYRRVLSPAGEG